MTPIIILLLKRTITQTSNLSLFYFCTREKFGFEEELLKITGVELFDKNTFDIA